MKKRLHSQSGFVIFELILVVVVLAAIAGAGYLAWHQHNKKSPATTAASTSSYTSPAVTTPSAPQITKASDLNTALSALNQTSVTSSNTDSSQLSTDASGF